MGMSGSADIFQAEMMDLMETLEYVRAYIDDLFCITRGSLEDHLDKLEEVLKRLCDAGLKVNAAKSFFCTHEIEYLGYMWQRPIVPIQWYGIDESSKIVLLPILSTYLR